MLPSIAPARLPLFALLASLTLVGCPKPKPANEGPAEISEVAPVSSASAAASAKSPGFRVTAAMKTSGSIGERTLVSAINDRIASLDACLPLVRKTDAVVGSLNVELTLNATGAVSPDLQSPVNDEASRCLLDGMRAWKLPNVGEGKAMVLLSLQDAK